MDKEMSDLKGSKLPEPPLVEFLNTRPIAAEQIQDAVIALLLAYKEWYDERAKEPKRSHDVDEFYVPDEQRAKEVCEWTFTGNMWEASCGWSEALRIGDFCRNCGRRIVEVK